MRLAILSTHPVQYYAPVFRALANCPRLEIKAFYGWKGSSEGALDRGFGQAVTWDIPLLDGYEHEFVPNIATDPGTHHFGGIDLPTLNQRINDWNADALLVYGWNFKAHLSALRHFSKKIPVYFRGDSTLLGNRSGWKKLLRSLFLRWIYTHIQGAFYVGAQNRRYYESARIKDSSLVFAPHAVDNKRFADPTGAYETAAQEWRTHLGIGVDECVTLFVGKLEPVKNPFDLLQAFANHGSGHLIFAGSGPLEAELRAKSKGNVHFIGFQNQSQMPIVYRLGDLVVLPSSSETWGLAINEAMACGRAVATSDQVGCAVDLIKEGENGWIFPVGNTVSLTQLLNRATTLGRSGLQTAGLASLEMIQHWSIENQATAIAKAVLEGPTAVPTSHQTF